MVKLVVFWQSAPSLSAIRLGVNEDIAAFGASLGANALFAGPIHLVFRL